MTADSPSPRTLLPRLLYVGDVPVESSYHGSALLYRLLQNYPPERLRILEGSLRSSSPERRLPGVDYSSVTLGWSRPLNTRFSRWAVLAYSFRACWRVGAIGSAIHNFQPEAVLTVAHDFLWLAACRFARKAGLPLHLVCHDDWPSIARFPPIFRSWLDHEFARTYCQAATRLCISPAMAEEYQRRYGASGTVLYPSRAADAPQFDAPPPRQLESNGPLTVAFAGTINSAGYVSALQCLSSALDGSGGRLLIFGPLKEAEAEASGLNCRNIELRGMVPSAELMNRLRAEADVLFVPMSFDPAERNYSALSFPSKLTDYTAVGLPLLIRGPGYCSAVRWATNHCGVAEVVKDESPAALAAALDRLWSPSHRKSLAETALSKGKEFFSHAAAERIFFPSLRRKICN